MKNQTFKAPSIIILITLIVATMFHLVQPVAAQGMASALSLSQPGGPWYSTASQQKVRPTWAAVS